MSAPLRPRQLPAKDPDRAKPDSPLLVTLRRALLRASFARIDNRRRIRDNAALRPGQTTATSSDGPYYIAGAPQRRDIREDRSGVPLTLQVRVVDAHSGRPLPGEVIGEVWQADAGGNYSGYLSYGADRFPAILTMALRRFRPTDTSRFLRGRQRADADGAVEFVTIVPGWYTPRTLHIHFKATVDGRAVVTTEFYFPDRVREQVLAQAPYAARGYGMFVNANDAEIMVAKGSPGSWPELTGDPVNGYTATISVRVRASLGKPPRRRLADQGCSAAAPT
jgi:protocatechuate 3,4-dioxygenase beta subunit